MKKITFLFLLGSVIFSSCSPESSPVKAPETSEEKEEEEEELSISYDNISNFEAQITSPNQFNSYNYKNVWNAIFHDPEATYSYRGEANLEYINIWDKVSASDISVTWRSNLDGVVYEGVLENDYASEFEKQLSKGYHTLSFEIKVGDNEEYIRKDSISFSNLISLSTESRAHALLLKWTKYEEDDFQSYLILAEGKLIAEFEDINTLQFLHEDVRLATPETYQVIIKRASGTLKPLHGSNLVEAEAGNILRIPHFITDVAKLPHDNLIYALVGQRTEQKDYADDYGVLILKDTEEALLIDGHILKNKRFSDLAISQDGKFLFLVSKKSEYITRVDLTTHESKDLYVDTKEWGLQRIEVGPDYRLYVARRSPTSGTSPMYIIDGLTGEHKSDYYSLIHGDIVYNNSNNKLYHNTTIWLSSVFRFSVENDLTVLEKSFTPEVGFPFNFMLISNNGKHIFWDKFQLDPDLNPVREFEEAVLSIDKHNQYISNGKELKDFQTLETLYTYPLFPVHDKYISNEIFNDRGDIIFFKPYQLAAIPFETVILKFNISEVIEL